MIRPDLWDRTGAQPVLAAGNAARDIDMLRTARFALVVHHNHDVREYAYDDSQILNAAAADGWTVLSMRDDFAAPVAGRPRRWRSVTGRTGLLVLRSFQQAAWSVLRSVLGFPALVLNLAGILLRLALGCLRPVLCLLSHTHDHSSSPPDTPQSGGCHLPRWIQRKPWGGGDLYRRESAGNLATKITPARG